MENIENKACIEFYLKEKTYSINIVDRVHINYGGVDFSIKSFINTLFDGKPFGSQDSISGLDILRLIDLHCGYLYEDEYRKVELDSALHTSLNLKRNTWLRKVLTFLVYYFRDNDLSTWDIVFIDGVVSFVPEEGSIAGVVKQDIIEDKEN